MHPVLTPEQALGSPPRRLDQTGNGPALLFVHGLIARAKLVGREG
jgi:hypothetical protein